MLSDNDRELLNKSIAGAEELTKAQIVLATINRCDNYAEVPWKAFALGVSVAGFSIFLIDLFTVRWVTDMIVLFVLATILTTGIIFSLLTVFIPPFARIFVSGYRRESETLQYAEHLFLTRELFATEGRRGILLLISRFEKQVVMIPDTGIRHRLSEDVIKSIITKMTPYLRKNEFKNALENGLKEITEVLRPPLSGQYDKNELSDEIIEEKGE